MRKITLTIIATILCLTSDITWSDDLQKARDASRRGDYATALREFKALAELGDPEAQYAVASFYVKGQGIPKDYKTAVKWYRLSAEQGHAESQSNLGFMYLEGQGVQQNDKTAVKWFRLSAEQGWKPAQINLGVMYGVGRGVKIDYVYAHMWAYIASPNFSNKLRDMVEIQMTAAQLAEAQALAQKCIAKKYKGC